MRAAVAMPAAAPGALEREGARIAAEAVLLRPARAGWVFTLRLSHSFLPRLSGDGFRDEILGLGEASRLEL